MPRAILFDLTQWVELESFGTWCDIQLHPTHNVQKTKFSKEISQHALHVSGWVRCWVRKLTEFIVQSSGSTMIFLPYKFENKLLTNATWKFEGGTPATLIHKSHRRPS